MNKLLIFACAGLVLALAYQSTPAAHADPPPRGAVCIALAATGTQGAAAARQFMDRELAAGRNHFEAVSVGADDAGRPLPDVVCAW